MTLTHKLLVALGTCALTFSLLACGASGSSGSPITNFLDQDTVEFMQNWDIYTPTSLTYTTLFETSMSYGTTDIATMKTVHDAIMNVRVGNEASERVTDKNELFTFTLPSGKSFYVSFENRHLIVGDKVYEVSGDEALWSAANELVKTANTDDLAKDVKGEVEDATVPATGGAAAAGGSSSSSAGSSSSNATSSSGGTASVTSGGTEESSSEQSGGSGLTTSAEAESDAGSTEAESSEPRQWMEPLGETTDGRNIETLVSAE